MLKTDNGSYRVEATDLALPISYQMDFHFRPIFFLKFEKHRNIRLMRI